MNWSLERINNHNMLYSPETLSRERNLNRHKMFRMVSKNELKSFNPVELLEWRKQRSLQLQPSRLMQTRNILIGNQMRKLSGRRDMNDNEIVTPLSIHKFWIHIHKDTHNNVKEAWSSRAQF